MSILAYTPEDMTVSVTADTTLAALQAQLGQHGQWLPIDPPNPDRVTIGEVISLNLSGPRRYGCGTIRDHLLGIRVELADGKLVKAGGNVVKNVAGYDLCKLYTGARGTLGTVREATFKVRPLPETEQFAEARFDSIEAACAFVDKVDGSPLTPVVLDLHNLGARASSLPSGNAEQQRAGSPRSQDGQWTVVVGFAGVREDVEWQRQQAAQFAALSDSNLDYDAEFWSASSSEPLRKISVLPSKLADALKGLTVPVVARAGNGVIYYRGGPEAPKQDVPQQLLQRVKDAFDPDHKLNSLPA